MKKHYYIFLSFVFLALACEKQKATLCSGYSIYIPNSFSPNGDGVNDFFVVKGDGIVSFEMWIVDGNGKQIYHCTDINNLWNGEPDNSGTVCPEGSYSYKMNTTDACGNSHTYTGTLILVK